MSSKTIPVIDWEKGSVFVQEGRLYVSPNCARPVCIPSSRDPKFPVDITMKFDDYKQPVWWTDGYGWMSFIPLSPSFLNMPFSALCWYPRTQKIICRSTQKPMWQMRIDDGLIWNRTEERIIEAVMKLRVIFKISTTLPPVPSTFDYTIPYPTQERCLLSIERARDWFGVWMGLFSFLIAQIKLSRLLAREDRESEVPVWYTKLLQSDSIMWSENWLNGIKKSTINQFVETVPRAGVIFRWTLLDKTRPDIGWFLEHNVPLFYQWTASEEEAISSNHEMMYLQPPCHMVQEALTLLYTSTSLPMAALVLRNYEKRDLNVLKKTEQYVRFERSASTVVQVTWSRYKADHPEMMRLLQGDQDMLNRRVDEFLEDEQYRVRKEAEHAARIPTLSMLYEDDESERGAIIEDFDAYMDAKGKRTAELIKAETPMERQVRIDRSRNPGKKKADVYEWAKITTSGGKTVYTRTRVKNNWKEEAFCRFAPSQTRFDGYWNEWDLCRDLDPEAINPEYDDDEEDYGPPLAHAPFTSHRSTTPPSHIHSPPRRSQTLAPSHTPSPPRRPSSPPPFRDPRPRRSQTPPPSQRPPVRHSPASPLSRPMDLDPVVPTNPDIDKLWLQEMIQIEPREKWNGWMRRDVVEFFSFGHGYVPPLGLPEAEVESDRAEAFGYMFKNCGFGARGKIGTESLVPPNILPSMEVFYKAMCGKNKAAEIIPPDLYDLDPTNRVALVHQVDFGLIHRPAENLFVFSHPRSASVKWLLGVESAEVALYVLRYSMSNPNHTILTIASRLVSRGIKCRTLLGVKTSTRQRTVAQPYRAESLRQADYIFTQEDFIAWHHECRSMLLSRPHGRAALLMGGIVARIALEFITVDTALRGPSKEVTEYGVGYMCYTGSDNVYYCDDELTDAEVAAICGAYTLYDEQCKRTSVKYWFPPPTVFNNHKCGYNWVEWTDRNEYWLDALWSDYEAGKAQPKTVDQWIKSLRGFTFARYWCSTNRERAKGFMDTHCPVRRSLVSRIE